MTVTAHTHILDYMWYQCECRALGVNTKQKMHLLQAENGKFMKVKFFRITFH